MKLLNRILGRKPRPIDNVSPRAQRLLVHARQVADRFSHANVGREHLLLGLLDLGEGVGIATLKNLGIDLAKLRKTVEGQMERGQQLRIEPSIAAREDLMSALRVAAAEAEALGHSYLGTEHVLLALVGTADGIAGRALQSLAIEITHAREIVVKTLSASASPK